MTLINNIRKHGDSPYNVVVVHGGPGAIGDMFPVAKKLSEKTGVIEPLFTGKNLTDQLNMLHYSIDNYCNKPVVLIGHSYGAWLSFIFAANNSSLVRKLILVSSGPFRKEYVNSITKSRMLHLNDREKEQLKLIYKKFQSEKLNKSDLKKISIFLQKTDYFHPVENIKSDTKLDSEVYSGIWPEISNLRDSGDMLREGTKIICPVVIIHGLKDPHPYEGVEEPLSCVIQDLSFILIEKCGHYPWFEEHAHERFYNVLNNEIFEHI